MVRTCSFSLPPVNRREVLRYAGAKAETQDLRQLLEDALAEAEPVLSGAVCWQEFPLTFGDGLADLGFSRISSESLRRNLTGCDRVILFGATVGLGIDRLIARYSRISPSSALMLQAIGAERVEALCDTFCDHIRQLYPDLHQRPRFSPGYGDFPLQTQADIFRVLDCSRKIGLTLNQSFLMSPSKSVTAIIGLGPCCGTDHSAGCRSCGKADCSFRRMP